MAAKDRQPITEPPPVRTAVTPPPLPPSARGSRKTRVGEVISNSMNKTIVVRTTARVPHPKFGKIVKQQRKFYVHDEENKAKAGDTVRIMETRPLSKLKRWRLVEVLQK
jgi:small subunit ribosomal protein S17